MNNKQYEEFIKLAEEQKRLGKDLTKAAEELDSYMSHYRATGVGKSFAGMFYSDMEKDNLSALGSHFSREIDKLHAVTQEMNDAYLKLRMDIPELHQSEFKALKAKALVLQKEIASQETLLKLDARKRNSQVAFSTAFFISLGVIGWYWGSVVMCLIVASLFLLYGSWVAALFFSPPLQQNHKELEENKVELQNNIARQAELSLEMY